MNYYDGKITTTKPLDYEAKKSFNLEIIAMVIKIYQSLNSGMYYSKGEDVFVFSKYYGRRIVVETTLCAYRMLSYEKS